MLYNRGIVSKEKEVMENTNLILRVDQIVKQLKRIADALEKIGGEDE